MRRILLGLLAALSIAVLGHAAEAQYSPAGQPLGSVADLVLLNQGTGCANNIAPCQTVWSPSLRFGQPIQTNCTLNLPSPWQYQECIDTSDNPPILKEFIGSTWWPILTLNPSSPGPVISIPANSLTSPFELGSTSVTTTGTQLNYLNAATGTTGSTSSNLVFSNAPTLASPIETTPSVTGGTYASPALTTPTITNPAVTTGTFASPALTGVPTAPTAAPGTNTTQIATTAFVAGATSSIPIDVFSVGGQSNAQGQSGDLTLSPSVNSSYVLQYSTAQCTAGTHYICPGNDPVGDANPSSAWPAFGITYVAATGHRVLFVPSAVGGTDQCSTTGVSTLNWDVTSQGAWGSQNTLAPALVSNVSAAMAAARAQGYTPTYKGILWSQGENDAGAIGANPAFPNGGATTVTGGPYGAGTTAITVASGSNLSNGEFAVISLTGGSTFTSSFTISGTNVTLATGVPAGQTVPNGAAFLLYSKGLYENCLRNMLNYFRTTTTDGTTFPELPFYISQTGGPQTGDNLGYQKVRQAQDEVAQSDPYTKIVFRGAVDFITRGMMQSGALHYLQEGYNEMGREMAKGVVAAQQSEPWLHQNYNVFRVALGGTLRVADQLTITLTSSAITSSPWELGPVTVTSTSSFCPVANGMQVNASQYSPNLQAVGITVTYTCSASGAVLTFYQPITLSPQASIAAAWITGGATETVTLSEGTSAYGWSPNLYYDQGNVTIGSSNIGPDLFDAVGDADVTGILPLGTNIFPMGSINSVAAGTDNIVLRLGNNTPNDTTDQRVSLLFEPDMNLFRDGGAGGRVCGNFIESAAVNSGIGAGDLRFGGYNCVSGGKVIFGTMFHDGGFGWGSAADPGSGNLAVSGTVTAGGGFNLGTLTFGTHLTSGGSSYNGSANTTITSDATNANTASTIVARDASGNFSAGTITASLTGGASLDLPLTGGTLSGGLTANAGATINDASSQFIVTSPPNAVGTNYLCWASSTGVVSIGGSCASSDARLKDDWRYDVPGLDAIMALKPGTFDWLDRSDTRDRQVGLTAQSVEKFLPEAVSTGSDRTITLADGAKKTIKGVKSLDYAKLTLPLIVAVQQQQREIAGLKAEIGRMQKSRHHR